MKGFHSGWRLAPVMVTCVTIFSGLNYVFAQTDAAQRPPVRPSSVAFHPCRLPRLTEEVRCTTYRVYENRDAKNGRKIDLKVAVIPALSPNPYPDPLFILAGGPGQAVTDNADFFASTFANVRRNRDIVLVDQRGTGSSNRLDCDLYGEEMQSYFGDRFPAEGARACRDKLAGRADLTRYTTPIAMDDLDEVRGALGYDRINLFGTSYGTRAALVYLRRHPNRVRSAILKGVMSFDLSPTRDTERALGILLDDCAADEACRAAYPGIKQEYDRVLDRLGSGSVKVEVQHPVTGKPAEVELPRVVFLSTLRGLLQNVATASQVLSLIHQSAQNNFVPFAQLVLSARRGAGSVLSIGMTLSVLCSEDAVLSGPGSAIGPDALDSACQDWPRGKLPSDYKEPVAAATPALLISGFLDPATPPRWGEEIARHLPNSLHVIVRNGSHSYSGLSPCVDNIMAEFISKASVKGLDVSCVDQIRRPPFQLPSAQTRPGG